MKALFYIITLLLHFVSVRLLMLYGNFVPVTVVFLGCLTAGLMIRYSGNTSPLVKDLGWGIFYGSVTSFACVMVFVFLLAYFFSR